MGKNLKGKNCGKGICQRKDGLYYARFVNKAGKRHETYFQTLPEARNWIENSKYADKHENVFIATDTTVGQKTQQSYRKWYAAKGTAKATGTRQYQNNKGSVSPCDY